MMLTVCLIQRDVSMEDVVLSLEDVLVTKTVHLVKYASTESARPFDVHVILTVCLQRDVSMENVVLSLSNNVENDI